MAAYKDVVLQSVGKVRVYRPPNMKIHRMVSAKYHYPPQPTRDVEMYRGKNEPKEVETVLIVEGPEFDAWRGECDSIDEARFTEINDYNYLYALKDVKMPDDFDPETEFGEFARMLDENWKPRGGSNGRRLDYLEWVVMGLADDATVISEALNELLGISQEVVDDVKDSFPSDVEGAAA
jgi:hypothetical protein